MRLRERVYIQGNLVIICLFRVIWLGSYRAGVFIVFCLIQLFYRFFSCVVVGYVVFGVVVVQECLFRFFQKFRSEQEAGVFFSLLEDSEFRLGSLSVLFWRRVQICRVTVFRFRFVLEWVELLGGGRFFGIVILFWVFRVFRGGYSADGSFRVRVIVIGEGFIFFFGCI